MQKVEGSSPFSRLTESPCKRALSEPSVARPRLGEEGFLVAHYGFTTENPGARGCPLSASRASSRLQLRAPARAARRSPAHVEHLLVDAQRERRVGVADQVHGAPRRHVADGEHRGERAPQRVRRQVCDRRRAPPPRAARWPARAAGRGCGAARCWACCAGRCGSRTPARPGRTGSRARCSPSRSRRAGRAGSARSPASVLVTSRRMRRRPAARSRWWPSSPHSSLTRRPASSSVSITARRGMSLRLRGLGALVPELAAAHLADQRVRDAELAGERDGRGAVEPRMWRDLLPVQAARRRLERVAAASSASICSGSRNERRGRSARGPALLRSGSRRSISAAPLGVAQDALGAVERLVDRRVARGRAGAAGGCGRCARRRRSSISGAPCSRACSIARRSSQSRSRGPRRAPRRCGRRRRGRTCP